MKLRLLFLLAFFTFNVLAQDKLSKSKQVSDATFVYKITDNEAVGLLKDKKVNDNFYHTLISENYYKDYRKKELPFGNYLFVNASGGFLNTSFHAQNNVSLQFVNNQKDFQFYIADRKGNLIANAIVEIDGKKKTKYDDKAKLYRSSYTKENGQPKEDGLIKVVHEGVSNFFEYELDDNNNYDDDSEDWSFFKKIVYSIPVKYFWQPLIKVLKNNRKTVKTLYAGYLVFSKPIYKPLDTLKFKTYVMNAKGGEITNRPADVVLQTDGARKTLATINPYKNGGYEYSFVLADSLNLKLDRSYSVSLEEKSKKPKNAFRISNYFRYEDYELKSLDFSLRTDRGEQTKDSLITVYFKATDENELTVPDGRVELVLTTSDVTYYGAKRVFVPDTLWQKNITLDPVGETKLVLPANIFPNANLSFNLFAKFLNSNNEVRTGSKYLTYSYTNVTKKASKPIEVKSEFKKDSLAISYLSNGKSLGQSARLVSYTSEDVIISSQQIELPFTVKTDYRAAYYDVETPKDTATIYVTELKPELQINAVQNKDSLRVVVINEDKVPFWYTIFSANEVFLRGYTNELDTLIKNNGKNASHIRINYVWDGDEETSEVSAFYNPNQLNLKLVAPEMVYPGQKVNMLVRVTDINKKPVAATDITAQAFTAKFKDAPSVRLPYLGKKYSIRKNNNIKVEAEEAYGSDSKKLDQQVWQKWRKTLGLDSVEYFKFMHPNPIYSVVEATNDTTTQVAPFAVLDGAILPASIVYIDDVPVFFNQAQQLQRYSFIVKPGYHDFKIRTANKLINVKHNVVAGKKTMFSVLADTTNKLVVINRPTTLTLQESQELDNYMIKVINNFQLQKTTISAQTSATRLLINPNNRTDGQLLVGPIRENALTFDNEKWRRDFTKEAGYTYTFEPGLVKQKSNTSKFAFEPKLAISASNGNTNIVKEYALKQNEIDKIWLDYMDLRSRTTLLFDVEYAKFGSKGKLRYDIDTAFTNHIPYIKNVVVFAPDKADFLRIYKGDINTDIFESGKYKLLFLLKDNRYFVTDSISVKPNGANYYRWKNFKIAEADVFSQKLDSIIKAVPSYGRQIISEKHKQFFNSYRFDVKELKNTMKGKVVSAENGKPLPGIILRVVGLTTEFQTDKDGNFELKTPEKGKVAIRSRHFYEQTVDIVNGIIGDIKLRPINGNLETIEILANAVQRKQSMTASAVVVRSESLDNSLQGSVAGVLLEQVVTLRGSNAINANKKPLIIVDGLPFDGDISSLDKNLIKDIILLKDASATAIYGSQAANGVIIVKTKNGNLATNVNGEAIAQQQTIRTNFNDEGFWQPKLITDENGEAKFAVKFPDDITKWTTRVIAMNGNKQTGYTEGSIKSFKSLSANFVSPQFAVTGDSINVIGKLMNYTPLEETGVRKFSYNGKELRNSNVKFKNSLIDTLGIKVSTKDSLSFEYTLQQENGYFDGERRKIPVFEAGVKETKGYFSALLRDTTLNYTFDKQFGKITVRAEASIFPTLLDEMTKLRNYEYLCNEQLASKLKALLLEKRVRKYLDQKFTHEKDIAFILKKLQQHKKPQGTWGWWQNSEEQIWISLHVVEALLQAQKDGYTVDLNKPILQRYLVGKLTDLPTANDIQIIRLLYLLDSKNYIKDWVLAYEKHELDLEKKKNADVSAGILTLRQSENKISLRQTLEMLELKQLAGIKIDLNPILKLKKQTMFGSVYWGEESIRFWDNSIQLTLLAYRILERAGGYESDLEKIALYFLEQRKDGQWRNTYESSLILEAILPTLMVTNTKAEPASIKINEQVIKAFPFSQTIERATDLSVQKTGKSAVYFTAYQQFQNAKPNKVDKDFKVSSTLIQNGVATNKLKAGALTKLRIEVEARADAAYVMIEIPIPAGCSYENKPQNFWGIETHREYFKNKTSIFCTKLKQGKYMFEIDLMPRYSGNYILNPAKAELMYFPVFYGREGMKNVEIR